MLEITNKIGFRGVKECELLDLFLILTFHSFVVIVSMQLEAAKAKEKYIIRSVQIKPAASL